MRSENFIAFFTVSGFFIAMIFSLLKSTNAIEFLYWVAGITLFFYLFIHLILIFFFNIDLGKTIPFESLDSEAIANYQISKLEEREEDINKILRTIKQLKE